MRLSDPLRVSSLRRRLLAGAAGVTVVAGGQPLARTPLPAAEPARSEDRGGPLPQIGSRFELPDLPLLDGTTLPAAGMQGKVVVLYWWASWCPFCAEQSPHMQALWRTHRDRGLHLHGLSIDRRPEDANAYLAKRGYDFPVTWLSAALKPAFPKPKGLPVTVVLARDGRVAASEAGQMFPEDVQAIARFL